MNNVINRKILFVEDNTQLLFQMAEWFIAKNNEVRTAKSLIEAKTVLDTFSPEMIILDVILPDGSGLELLKNLDPLPPVIVLSDLGSEENILEGFQAGATDYIVKPCSMRLLEARISLRFLPPNKSVLVYGGLSIDSNNRTAFYLGKSLNLTSSEFNILWFLMNHPNQFFTSDQIYEYVWDAPSLKTTTIRRHLSTLRQKLKELSTDALIRTEFGKGYIFLPQGATE